MKALFVGALISLSVVWSLGAHSTELRVSDERPALTSVSADEVIGYYEKKWLSTEICFCRLLQ